MWTSTSVISLVAGAALACAGPELSVRTPSPGANEALGFDPMPAGLIGGHETDRETRGSCVTPATELRIRAGIAAYVATHGPLSTRDTDLPAPPFVFWPQGGTLYKDLNMGNFVDLDPTSGVRSYLCDDQTYDTHRGIDCGSPWWSQVDIGMPIFAAADGVVVDAHDGEPDRNTFCVEPPNYVIIDHGNGRVCWYLHMKLNSVAVSVGQPVRAGQQIGLVASSGCSYGPHLHFQVMDSGSVFEPFAGACRPGASGWVQQIDPPAAGAYIKDFGVTAQDIGAAPPSPARPPVDAQMAFTDPLLYYWINVGNMPANSTWRERYVRPNGTTYAELGPFSFNNASTYGWSLWWFSRNLPEMRSVAGTWRIQFEINGATLVDAPVVVVPTRTPGFNRAPAAFTASFDPSAPAISDAVFARVDSAPGFRDPDGDVVRYRYVWRLNGSVVRDVTSAGMADAVPAGLAATSGVLSCTITGSDGTLSATPVTISTAIGCFGNCDASTTPPVLNAGDFSCFLNRFRGALSLSAAAQLGTYANCDASTTPPVLNAGDFSCFLTKFRAGCP